MSDKNLQRAIECVSDIEQPARDRRTLPARRHHITQKAKIAGQRTLSKTSLIRRSRNNPPCELSTNMVGGTIILCWAMPSGWPATTRNAFSGLQGWTCKPNR